MSFYRSCLDSVLVSRASLDSQDSLSQSLASPQEDQHMEDDFRQSFFSTFFTVVFTDIFGFSDISFFDAFFIKLYCLSFAPPFHAYLLLFPTLINDSKFVPFFCVCIQTFPLFEL
jgi:hypothetical protein